MTKLERGRYLTLITRAVERDIEQLGPSLAVKKADLHKAEAADRLALHLSQVIRRGIDALPEEKRVEAGASLVSELVSIVAGSTFEQLLEQRLLSPPQLLSAVLKFLPDGREEELPEPLVPLMDTALMTNAPGEPRLGQQINSDIPSADRVDLIMAFIRQSGIAPLLPALKRHCESGCQRYSSFPHPEVRTISWTTFRSSSCIHTKIGFGP